MDRLLNFEAETLLNEDAFSGEAEDESQVVRDQRAGQPGGGSRGAGVRPGASVPRPVRGSGGGPGFLGRPVVINRPLILGTPMIGGGRPFAGGPRGLGSSVFRPRAGFPAGFPGGFPGAPGFRLRNRFGRFGFLRRPPFAPGMGLPGVGFPGTGIPMQTGFGAAPAASRLVAWAQSCLAQMGDATVPQNGILGPRTRRAVAAFQTQQQLPATGVLDNDTIAALQAACAPQDGGEQTGDGQ